MVPAPRCICLGLGVAISFTLVFVLEAQYRMSHPPMRPISFGPTHNAPEERSFLTSETLVVRAVVESPPARSSVEPTANSGGLGDRVAWSTGATSHRTVCEDIGTDALVRHGDISPEVTAYISKHVFFAIVTGSFDHFFRADIALCTWLQHAPSSNVLFVTDNASYAVVGGPSGPAPPHRARFRWLEASLPPGISFSRKQIEAKGYTVGWIKAQFRFIQGLEAMAVAARVPGYDKQLGFNASSADDTVSLLTEPRWFLVLDDDTFTALTPLVKMLRSYDAKLCKALSKSTTADDPCVGVDPARIKPTYIGERGWGGAGHIFSYSAVSAFLRNGYEDCVRVKMVTKFYASDVALKKCLPGAGVNVVADDRLSHCQATFLRDRLLNGHHVTSHVKREIDMHPRFFALWRMRLYYQTMYQGNRSAYATLLLVGSCAYGSCRIGKCLRPHDIDSTDRFTRLSRNNTVAPWL